jgi:ubiquinone/menaquinone biosynthesis C-methylase UbiE
MTDLEQQRAAERAKYDAIYSGFWWGPSYGYRGNHWEKGMDLFCKYTSVCDVGTGSGHFPTFIYQCGADLAVGVDFAMPAEAQLIKLYAPNSHVLVLMRAPAHDLPLGDGQVQYVTAFDVMEHLLPEEIDDVLEEFMRVSYEGIALSINYQPHDPPAIVERFGSGLHRTVRPKEWWIQKIKRVTGFTITEHLGKYLIAKRASIASSNECPRP